MGIFFGSVTGQTERTARRIADSFGPGLAEVHDIGDVQPSDLNSYDLLIFGTSTWSGGTLPEDWAAFLPQLDRVDFDQRQVAFFGLGDQMGYPERFLDAMGRLYHEVTRRGGKPIGSCSAAGFVFLESRALTEGHFVGLPVDDNSQPYMTQRRITDWVSRLRRKLGD